MSLAPFIMALKRKKSLKFCAIGCIIKEETRKGGGIITLQQQIEMALAYAGNVKKSDIAAKFGVTTSAFVQRLRTGKFTKEELEEIAASMDAEYISYFQFKDGTKI